MAVVAALTAGMNLIAFVYLPVSPVQVQFGEGSAATLMAGFGGAALGAMVGGVVDYLLTRRAHRIESLKYGHALLSQLLRIERQSANVVRTFAESFTDAEASGVVGEIWQKFAPFAPPEPIRLEEKHYSPLIELKGYELHRAVMCIADEELILNASLRRIIEQKSALDQSVGNVKRLQPGLYHGRFETSDLKKASLFQATLPDFIEQVLVRYVQHQGQARQSCHDLCILMRSHFGKDKFPLVRFGEPVEELPRV